jgi:demethylmenaquinone methyltransferase/2-methoxy-6-polyprenyl-1,4-benzoquinol methylase
VRRTAPIPALLRYVSTPDDRRRWTSDLFDRTAPYYNRICQTMSAGTDASYRREALARSGISAGHHVLDLATGTGLLARAAASLVGVDGRVIGSDLSRGMLHEARAALGGARVQAGAEDLPFRDGSFDVVTMGYALRHVGDLETLFTACHRVLRPGGRLILLEITKPRSRIGQALTRAYFGRVVPLLSFMVTGRREAQLLMRYYWDTIDHCVPPETILDALRQARFVTASRHVHRGIFSEYVATRPTEVRGFVGS